MLLAKIKSDSLDARKARDSAKATSLVTRYAEAARVGKDAGGRNSTDLEVLAVVRKFIKGLDDSLTVLKDPAAIAKAQAERLVLGAYLPAQISGDALAVVIAAIVEAATDKTAKGMGFVMNALKSQYGGTYDGAEAGKLVKAALAG